MRGRASCGLARCRAWWADARLLHSTQPRCRSWWCAASLPRCGVWFARLLQVRVWLMAAAAGLVLVLMLLLGCLMPQGELKTGPVKSPVYGCQVSRRQCSDRERGELSTAALGVGQLPSDQMHGAALPSWPPPLCPENLDTAVYQFGG